MNSKQTAELTLEELAAEAVRLGRELERAAHAVSLGGSSRTAGFVGRTLSRLAERDPFDPRDEASFTALEGIIEADLKTELRGSERRFFETHHDDLGPNGEIRDCPVYSERGDKILALQKMFARFVHTRAATLDRVAA